MAKTVDRAQLGAIWGEVTALDDVDSSPLAQAIIHEALEGGGDGEGAMAAVFKIARDCEDFAEAIGAATIEQGGG